MSTPNIRIVRKIRSAQGAVIRTEVGGSWYSPPIPVSYVQGMLAEFQTEEPSAGWTIETRGSDRDWHPSETSEKDLRP